MWKDRIKGMTAGRGGKEVQGGRSEGKEETEAGDSGLWKEAKRILVKVRLRLMETSGEEDINVEKGERKAENTRNLIRGHKKTWAGRREAYRKKIK